MSTNARTARTTVASLAAEFRTFAQAQQAHNAAVTAILASLTDSSPASVTTKSSPAKKAVTRKPAKKAAAKPAPKGAQTRETLSRKDWNRTLTTLAKTQPKGSGAYALVLASWSDMQEARDAGMTPREALALVIG